MYLNESFLCEECEYAIIILIEGSLNGVATGSESVNLVLVVYRPVGTGYITTVLSWLPLYINIIQNAIYLNFIHKGN